MADKFRDTFPVAVDFVKGEQPSSDKFRGWAAQTNTGLQVMEKALGNLWGDEVQTQNTTGDPYMLTRDQKRTSQVVNLAALIGPASALNPHRVSDRSAVTVTMSSGDIPAGVNEFQLPFPALTYSSVNSLSVSAATSAFSVCQSIQDELEYLGSVFSQWRSTKEAMVASGDYHIDLNGRVYSYDPTPANSWAFSYTTLLAWDSYDYATPNVIPDVNNASSTGFVLVTLVGDEYTLALPTLTVVPGYNAVGNPIQVTDVAPAEYEAMLPYCLTNTLGNGDIIPDGFVQLWDTQHPDQTTGEHDVTDGGFVDGLTFTYVDANNLRVSGAPLSEGENRYRLITVGTNITETLQDVRIRIDSHAHDNPLGGNPVSHYNLSNNHIKPSQISTSWSVDVTSPASAITGNDHPQYLCRYGWKENVDPGQYDNAMLGDLFMAAEDTDITDGDYTSTTVDSRKIIFGDSTGPQIYFDGTEEDLVIETQGSSGFDIALNSDDAITLFAGGSCTLVATTSANIWGATATIVTTGTAILQSTAGIVSVSAGTNLTLSASNSYQINSTSGGTLSTDGFLSISGDTGISIESSGAYITLNAKTNLSLGADQNVAIHALDDVTIESGGTDNIVITCGNSSSNYVDIVRRLKIPVVTAQSQLPGWDTTPPMVGLLYIVDSQDGDSGIHFTKKSSGGAIQWWKLQGSTP